MHMALADEVAALVTKYGSEQVRLAVAALGTTGAVDELTIIANSGVHSLPSHLRRGLVIDATVGTLDFSSAEAAHHAHTEMLIRLVPVLKSQAWRTVYLAPFGPPTISSQIKLLVYRITRMETVDLLYVGNGRFFDVALQQRELIVRT